MENEVRRVSKIRLLSPSKLCFQTVAVQSPPASLKGTTYISVSPRPPGLERKSQFFITHLKLATVQNNAEEHSGFFSNLTRTSLLSRKNSGDH